MSPLVPTCEPPDAAVHHLTVPALTSAFICAVPAPHRVAPTTVPTVGNAVTVTVTAFRDEDTHDPLIASA